MTLTVQDKACLTVLCLLCLVAAALWERKR